MNNYLRLIVTLTAHTLLGSSLHVGAMADSTVLPAKIKNKSQAPVVVHALTTSPASPTESKTTPSLVAQAQQFLAESPIPLSAPAPAPTPSTAASLLAASASTLSSASVGTSLSTSTSSSAPAKKAIKKEINTDFSRVNTLPMSPVPSLERNEEQINTLNTLQWIKDAAELHTLSHENYLKKHVEGETLTVALPTADKQRAKFGHAANELAGKAANRRERNIVKRMTTLITWADAYNTELNQADLSVMKKQAIYQIQDALRTLALINSKIKETSTEPSPFDLVVINTGEHKE